MTDARTPPLIRAASAASGGGRIAALDGLRAVAVGLVVVHHAWQPNNFGGFVGVDVFFVLSGYLITSIIRRQMAAGNFSLGRFYWNRAVRLYPALIVAILVCLPLGLLLNPARAAATQVADAAFALAYVMNIVEHTTGDFRWLWSHTWSLAMEEQFYLAWPLALLALAGVRASRRTLIAVVAAVALASAAWHAASFDPAVPDFSPLARVQGLAAGCGLALFLENAKLAARWASRASTVLWGGAALLAIAVAMGTLAHGWLPIPLATLASTLLIGGLVVQGADGGPLSRTLAWRPIVYVGVISYGIYLWHFPLQLLGRVAPGEATVWVPLSVLASVGLAAASHHWVEQPAMRLQRR